MDTDKEKIRAFIRKNYADVALHNGSGGCCGSGCTCNSDAAVDIKVISAKIGYTEEDIKNVPPEANMGLGCGNPLAFAGLKEGDVVLDLGSGGGYDCFLARAEVGVTGHIIGVDMTPEMVELARNNAKESGFANVEFRLGEIEHLPLADASVDIVISNCVINLSLDKEQVFREIYRVLKPGGRICASDVVATAVLPESIRQDLSLIASCIGGAAYIEDLKAILQKTGFINVKLTPRDNSREIITTWLPDHNIEDYVASHIIEGTKVGTE